MMSKAEQSFAVLKPDCSLPEGVHACTTVRAGGFSQVPYAALNLGLHVGDAEGHVRQNRRRLVSSLALPDEPLWLHQTHGISVCRGGSPDSSESFDASWTDQPRRVLAVLTADCLPVVFASTDGQEIAVAHAGWRGLAAGVLQNTIRQFKAPSAELIAWMGPAIGPECFEVGQDVLDSFRARLGDSAEVESAFEPAQSNAAYTISEPGKWFADLYQLATFVLRQAGVNSIYGGGLCTYSDADRFFSYRRDGRRSGRMATLVWRH